MPTTTRWRWSSPPTSTQNSGGFLVDPNASQFGGTFGVAVGPPEDRNSVYFQRPSAGVWHHYALVLNTTAPAASEITPYVDGQPVSVKQEGVETGQGAFANSTLYLFSRDGNSLFGAGDLQYLAIYNQPLSATTIFQHFYSYGGKEASEPPSEPPPPPDTTPPSGGALKVNGTPASEGGSSSYNTSGSFAIERTDYSEEKTKTQSGLASSTLTLASATLASNTCGTFGTPSTISASPAQSEPSGCYRYKLTGTDNAGNSASVTTTVKVDTTAPSTPALAFSGLSSNTYYNASTNTLYFRPAQRRRVRGERELDRCRHGDPRIHVRLAVGQRLLRNADRRAGGVRVRCERHAAGERPDPVGDQQRGRQLRQR